MEGDDRILARKAGREAARELLSLQSDQNPKEFQIAFWEELQAVAQEQLQVLCPKPAKSARPIQSAADKSSLPASVAEAFDIIDEIEELADLVPSAGKEFADSVRTTSQSIGDTIQGCGLVSKRQTTALLNMRDGLRKWQRTSDSIAIDPIAHDENDSYSREDDDIPF